MSPEDVERFNSLAHPEKWTLEDCVLWGGEPWSKYGGSKRQKHGMFLWCPDDDVQMMPAHRLAYLLYRGDFGNLLALHKCPGRTNKTKGQCINPLHIAPGDGFENAMDHCRDEKPDYTILTRGQIRGCYESRDRVSVEERARIYRISTTRVRRIDSGRSGRFITGAIPLSRGLSRSDIRQCFKERRALSCSARAQKYGVSTQWVYRLDNGRVHAKITDTFLNIVDV